MAEVRLPSRSPRISRYSFLPLGSPVEYSNLGKPVPIPTLGTGSLLRHGCQSVVFLPGHQARSSRLHDLGRSPWVLEQCGNQPVPSPDMLMPSLPLLRQRLCSFRDVSEVVLAVALGGIPDRLADQLPLQPLADVQFQNALDGGGRITGSLNRVTMWFVRPQDHGSHCKPSMTAHPWNTREDAALSGTCSIALPSPVM